MVLAAAFRNLTRSPKRSLIIFLLEAAIIAVFFLGNSILLQSHVGLQRSYVENFTGDAMVKVPTDLPVSIFGAITPSIGEFFVIPEIPDFNAVESLSRESEVVESAVPVLSGIAELRVDAYRGAVPLFGIEPDKYFPFFPGLGILDGQALKGNERGLLLTESRREEIASRLGRSLNIGDPVLLSAYGDGGFKIRELPLVGVIGYENGGEVLEEIVLLDVHTLRELNAVSLAIDESYRVESSAVSLIDTSLDSLFGDDLFSSVSSDGEEGSESLSLDSFYQRMDREDDGEQILQGGAWHFLLLRYADGIPPQRALRNLNEAYADLDLEVVNWRDAAGLSALLVFLLRIVFNGGFILVVTAGVIAIVNILVISVIERTGEIGTLRAIGASRTYVRKLLTSENLFLALISGLSGIIMGSLILMLFNRAEIVLGNSLLKSLFGNTVLEVAFSWPVTFWSLLLALVLGFLSAQFPTAMALRIQPVRAISQE